MVKKLNHKSNQKILLKQIPAFRKIFDDKLNCLSLKKRKLILIYFSIFSKELNKFHDIFPKLMFENENGYINNLLINKENNVVTFHVEYVYTLLKNYVNEELNVNNKYKICEEKLRNFIGKLIYQYTSIFNVCDQHHYISIMKNNIYEHYFKILKYHIKYYYPNFNESLEINNDEMNYIESDIDRLILNIRVVSTYLLSKVNINDLKYEQLKDAMCKYIDRIFYDHDKDDLINKDTKIYNIDDIKFNLSNILMSIFY